MSNIFVIYCSKLTMICSLYILPLNYIEEDSNQFFNIIFFTSTLYRDNRFLLFCNTKINLCLPKGVDTIPEGFFRPTKTIVSATKWLQLIVGSSFEVIFAEKKLPADPGEGVG